MKLVLAANPGYMSDANALMIVLFIFAVLVVFAFLLNDLENKNKRCSKCHCELDRINYPLIHQNQHCLQCQYAAKIAGHHQIENQSRIASQYEKDIERLRKCQRCQNGMNETDWVEALMLYPGVYCNECRRVELMKIKQAESPDWLLVAKTHASRGGLYRDGMSMEQYLDATLAEGICEMAPQVVDRKPSVPGQCRICDKPFLNTEGSGYCLPCVGPGFLEQPLNDGIKRAPDNFRGAPRYPLYDAPGVPSIAEGFPKEEGYKGYSSKGALKESALDKEQAPNAIVESVSEEQANKVDVFENPEGNE